MATSWMDEMSSSVEESCEKLCFMCFPCKEIHRSEFLLRWQKLTNQLTNSKDILTSSVASTGSFSTPQQHPLFVS